MCQVHDFFASIKRLIFEFKAQSPRQKFSFRVLCSPYLIQRSTKSKASEQDSPI